MVVVASDSKWEGMIIAKMLKSLSKNKRTTIYTQDKDIIKLTNEIRNIDITNDCKKADFVLSSIDKSCNKPMILFNYHQYKNTPDAIGVFFWQKGRPTIRFSKKRLNDFGLQVRGKLSKFVSTKNE
jgi:hypothetical protein